MLCPCPVFFNANRFPEKPAISWGGRSISWLAINNYVHSTSRYLKEVSVKKQGRVIVVSDPAPVYCIVLLALWRIGALACPVSAQVREIELEAVHGVVKPDFVISPRSSRKMWAKGVRWADIEQVVAYGYNDSFLGSDAALDPKIDADQVVVLRPVLSSTQIRLEALTYKDLQDDPQDLAALFKALSTGEKLVIS